MVFSDYFNGYADCNGPWIADNFWSLDQPTLYFNFETTADLILHGNNGGATLGDGMVNFKLYLEILNNIFGCQVGVSRTWVLDNPTF